ncbi:MAG TPA: hypothetical protein VFT22_39745 [Kofleriaceae bacterium]|nr:hypothetical protein [Kofleriaceae bacterium]
MRLVVQSQVHRLVDVHDDGRPERERRLFWRRNLSHHLHGELLGELFRRFDLPAWLPGRILDVDRIERRLSVATTIVAA